MLIASPRVRLLIQWPRRRESIRQDAAHVLSGVVPLRKPRQQVACGCATNIGWSPRGISLPACIGQVSGGAKLPHDVEPRRLVRARDGLEITISSRRNSRASLTTSPAERCKVSSNIFKHYKLVVHRLAGAYYRGGGRNAASPPKRSLNLYGLQRVGAEWSSNVVVERQ